MVGGVVKSSTVRRPSKLGGLARRAEICGRVVQNKVLVPVEVVLRWRLRLKTSGWGLGKPWLLGIRDERREVV